MIAGNPRAVAAMLEVVYPVGSIYMSTSETSPAVLFGGVWERIEGSFLLASNTAHPAGSTGGAATHELTKTELPKNVTFDLEVANESTPGDVTLSSAMPLYRYATRTTSYIGTLHPALPGEGTPIDIMPPYLAVNIWKRTA